MKVLIEKLWEDYCKITPDAKPIFDLLSKGEPNIKHDHIAFRTFNKSPVGLIELGMKFLDYGYREVGDYYFEQKKLIGKHYEHPEYPTVFLSALMLEEFSPWLQEFCSKLVGQTPRHIPLTIPHRPWDKISHTDYLKLCEESQYAGWVSVFGIRANHFTVSVNNLKDFGEENDIELVNKFLKYKGFELNESGGEVKGSILKGLRQSSTMAKEIDVEFSDGTFKVPSCYVEFAERHKINGKLFTGFHASSADKIFESTNKK